EGDIPSYFLFNGDNEFRCVCRDERNDPGTNPAGNDRTYFAVRITSGGELHGDMNPAHILRECGTSRVYGLGRPAADIDDESFTAAADRLFDERMGISLLWDSEAMTLADFRNEIVRHIDATHYVDSRTGKFKLKLIRNDYDVDDLLV